MHICSKGGSPTKVEHNSKPAGEHIFLNIPGRLVDVKCFKIIVPMCMCVFLLKMHKCCLWEDIYKYFSILCLLNLVIHITVVDWFLIYALAKYTYVIFFLFSFLM